MTFSVRDLNPEDRPGWERLWAGYLDFYEAALAPDITDLTWRRLLDPVEPMFCLLAEDDSRELIGLVHCVIHRGTWSATHFCYLEDLFTAPGARKSGVGRALIEAVYARADAMGCSRTYWLTHESNAEGRKLYDRLARYDGFIQYKRVQ